MFDEINKLSDVMKNLHQSAADLHDHADNVVDRVIENTMEAVPVMHRPNMSTMSSKLKNIFTISIRRMELMFEDDDRWFSITQRIKDVVQNEQTGYEFMKGIMQNAGVDGADGLAGYVKKYMMVLLMWARVLERLDELDILSVPCAAKLVGMFMTDIFDSFIKPMIQLNIINQFLPALDDKLKKDYYSQFVNLGKLLAFTAGICYAENYICGGYGGGAITGQLLYCYNDKWRKDDENDRKRRASIQ